MEDFRKEVLETVRGLRLIDDVFFRLIGERKDVVEEILRTLLDEKDLVVIECSTQKVISNLFRGVTLDALCELKDGRYVNVEVQKDSGNDDIRRCRFHQSIITAKVTPKGTKFKDIPDVIVIYITGYDALKNGQAITCAEMCQLVNGIYQPLDDGAKTIYANTVINDGTDQSELLALFEKRDTFSNAKFPKLSEAIKYYKDDEKGAGSMCNSVEELANIYAKEQINDTLIDIAKNGIKQGLTDEQIASLTGLTPETVHDLR